MKSADLLPNFFIIGAAKAGTTTLYDILQKYPQVYFPVQKEPSFFCDDEYYKKGAKWYSETFYADVRGFKMRGDATPRYLFWGEKVVPRMQSLYGINLPRIIVIFRDPVKLAYSYYWQNVRDGRENLSFRDALFAEEDRMAGHSTFLSSRGRTTNLYTRIGFYAKQIQPYLRIFPREKILFLLTNDFKDFSKLTMKLEKFLSLEHKKWDHPVVSNPASIPRSKYLHQWLRNRSKLKETLKKFLPYSVRHRLKVAMLKINLKKFLPPTLAPDIEEKLKEIFKPDIRKLETILKLDLSDWYKT